MENFRYDIFISYSREDRSFVEFVASLLKQCGLRCFTDSIDLKIFDKLDASLKEAIASSRYLMAVISPSYLRSYWCLFEAMEALESQDLALRFLPLVVRYTPEDQALDERFVLSALRDLDNEINSFEAQLISSKAYELAPKLAKLQFVRQSLPGVFRKIYERIFPEFTLWDDASIRGTLFQLVKLLVPTSTVAVDTIPLTFARLPATPAVVPKLQRLPTLVWQAKVGCQGWKNTPTVLGNRVFTASGGREWNVSDPEDGIYCLDAETGATIWFSPTTADANRVAVSKGVVLTGCDDGSLVAVAAQDGRKLWSSKFKSGIVGGPIKLTANVGDATSRRRGDNIADPLLVSTHDGDIYLVDLTSGRSLYSLSLGETLLAEPHVCRPDQSITFRTKSGTVVESDAFGQAFLGRSKESIGNFSIADTLILVPALSGALFVVAFSDTGMGLTKLQRYDPASEGISLGSEPTVVNGMVVQGFARQTYYAAPPLFAFEPLTGRVYWMASDPTGIGGEFGNLRHSPIVLHNEAIIATAYSNKICGLSLDKGEVQWTIQLGQEMFEQWSGPILVSDRIYVGRHEGYLHKIDPANKRREWSMFIGQSSRAGFVISGSQDFVDLHERAAWTSGNSFPVLATPTYDRGRVYIGTEEGFLYCIGNVD